MRRAWTGVFALLVTLAIACSGPSSATPTRGVTGPLRVSGNHLLDGHGHPVTLRGANVEFLDVYPYLAGSSLTEPGIATMARRGVTFLRVPLSEAFAVRSVCRNYRRDYLDLVDRVVRAATRYGIVVDLDLHRNPGAVACANEQRALGDSGSLTFWATVAARYRDQPLVVFDLYNEPHVSSWQLWRDGGVDRKQPAAGKLVGMQALYDAVRSTGAHNVVIASGNHWAGAAPTPDVRLRGNNIVYGWHEYACKKPPCATPPVPSESRARTWQAAARWAPVMVTEFGWPEDNAAGAAYERAVVRGATRMGAGWAAYQWADYNERDPYGILTDLGSWAPTVTGRPILDALGSAAAAAR